MKKLYAFLMISAMLLSCAAAEPASVPPFTGEALSQMTYTQVTDAYTAAYGVWWDSWTHDVWLNYAAALRQADVQDSRTGQAIAATDYILPPENALPADQAAALAVAAVDASAHAAAFFPCFLWEGRPIYKILLFTTPEGSIISSGSHCVELDALTGEVLGVYEPTGINRGEAYVPHAIWLGGSSLTSTRIVNGTRAVVFSYPADCKATPDSPSATFIHLNDEAYVVVVLLDEDESITQLFEETKSPEQEIILLAENLRLLSWLDKIGYGMPGWPVLDILEVGVTLPDGRSVIVQSTCPDGNTDIYDTLLTILGSITDAAPLADWMARNGIPFTPSMH